MCGRSEIERKRPTHGSVRRRKPPLTSFRGRSLEDSSSGHKNASGGGTSSPHHSWPAGHVFKGASRRAHSEFPASRHEFGLKLGQNAARKLAFWCHFALKFGLGPGNWSLRNVMASSERAKESQFTWLRSLCSPSGSPLLATELRRDPPSRLRERKD